MHLQAALLLHLLPLSQVADCETTRSVNRLSQQRENGYLLPKIFV